MTVLNKKEITDNCLTFLLAGYEASSATTGHIIKELATNPETQEKLIEEVDKYLAETDKPLFDIINKMPYLDACLKETLRLYPPATRIERKVVRHFHLDHIFIPKNSLIIIPVYAIHRDPNNFENPDQFIPERFLTENSRKLKSGTYLPFADGPRNCVGMKFAQMELKLCIAKIFTKFRFVECEKTNV